MTRYLGVSFALGDVTPATTQDAIVALMLTLLVVLLGMHAEKNLR